MNKDIKRITVQHQYTISQFIALLETQSERSILFQQVKKALEKRGRWQRKAGGHGDISRLHNAPH